MSPRRLLLLVVALLAAAAFGLLDVRERARVDRGTKAHRTDFTVYTAAARALVEGNDPYDARSPRGWRYVYPPLLAVALRPLLGLAVPDAAFVWYVVSVLALAFALRSTARGLGGAAGARATAVGAVVCVLFVGQTLQRGQVTTILLAIQVGAFGLVVARRDLLAGVLLALGVALRLTPLLPAGVLGVACLRRLAAGEGARAWRFPAGFVAGLVLWFVAVPALALGPARAREVTARWLEVGRAVYASAPGESADLGGEYGIEEHIFKNQGVRRIAATAIGWTQGRAFEGERPVLSDGGAAADRAALVVAALVGLGAVLAGWFAFGDPASRRARLAYGAVCLAPVLVTRYAWPVHFAVAIPFVAEAFAGRARPAVRGAFVAFVVGVVLFALGYLGKSDGLRFPARAGVLAIGTLVALALASRERRGTLAAPSSVPS